MSLESLSVKATGDFSDLIAGAEKGGKAVDNFSKVAQAATAKLGRDIPKGANQASNALLNLGRVAQDAPFGFIGIQNNINPLLESFQRLRAEAGSNAGALKALVSGLAGGAGLGLAVSIGTSLLTVFADKLFSSKKAAKEGAGDLAYLNRTQNEYNELLKKGTTEAAGNLATVSKLVAAAQLESTTYKERKDILAQLKDQSKEYFSGLTLENGLIVGLSDAYDRYANNIFRVAKAKAASGQIEKLGEQLVKVTSDLNDVNKSITLSDRNGLVGGLAAAKDKYKELNDLISKGNATTFAEQARIGELTGRNEKDVRDVVNKRTDLRNKETDLVGQIAVLSEQVAQDDFKSLGIHEEKEKKLKKEKTLLELIRDLMAHSFELKTDVIPAQVNIQPVFVTPDGTNPSVGELIRRKMVRDLHDFNIQTAVAASGTFKGKLVKIELLSEEDIKGVAEKFAAIKKQFQDFAVDLQKQVLTSGLSKIGETIGTAIAGGNVGDAFKGLFQVIIDGMKQLGEAMIGLGTAKVALEKFNLAPGIGTIIAGVGVIALSSLLQSALPKFAGGVTGFAGGLAIVGERGPEVVRLPQGSDVIPNHRLGEISGGVQVLIPSIALRGSDLLIQFDRASAQKRRRA
jgi:hypothetical protein